MTVRKLLQGKGNFVPFVRSDSSVGDAIELMEADEAGALVVTDDQRRIKGIVSERDVVRALSSHGANVMQASVSEIMTHDVITCAEEQPIARILQLMDEHQIRHIPITKDGELHGIVNMLDLVKYRLEQLEKEAEALTAYVRS